MKKKKLNKFKIVTLVLLNIFIIVMFYSLIHIIKYYKDNNINGQIMKDITNNLIIVEKKEDTNEVQYKINFEELKKQNKDTVGYIKVNGTLIDYPVVKSKDNNYYLKHNFYKKYNYAGWIFADYHNKFDGSDKNIVIYGHSMLNGSMFGTLKNVLSKDWYNNEENHNILFVDKDGEVIYKVFSTYITEEEDYYINTMFINNEFDSFIKKIKSRSKYKYDVDVDSNDTIITLSTCSGSNGNKRVVVHAKKLN